MTKLMTMALSIGEFVDAPGKTVVAEVMIDSDVVRDESVLWFEALNLFDAMASRLKKDGILEGSGHNH